MTLRRSRAAAALPRRLCGFSSSECQAYRLHDHEGDDLGLVEHPTPNVEPGDVVMLDDGREALVTARVKTDGSSPR
jgi:hypothetical protein